LLPLYSSTGHLAVGVLFNTQGQASIPEYSGVPPFRPDACELSGLNAKAEEPERIIEGNQECIPGGNPEASKTFGKFEADSMGQAGRG
jgi:hypothetical protein